MSKNEQIIYGFRPVCELLKSKHEIKTVWFEQGKMNSKYSTLKECCVTKNVSSGEKSRRFLEKLSQSSFHQGIVAIYVPLEKKYCFEQQGNPPRNKFFLCIYLDCIQDPQNFGAILRSCEFFGADQVFYPKHHGAPFNPVAMKGSAGAGIHNPPYKISGITSFFETVRNKKFQIIGAHHFKGKSLYDVDFQQDTLLVIGNEGSGISDKVLKFCTDFVTIPLSGKIDSLNASVSAGIILYEIQKKRM